MIKHFSISILLSFLLINFISAQKVKTDANLLGHVLCEGVHTPFANISLKGTTIGTLTDGTGHYMLTNLPVGDYIVVASFVGYKTIEKPVSLKSGTSVELNFDMVKDIFGLDEVVVSGNRNAEKRVETPLIINSISPKIFANAQSQSLSEGLNFCSGLRLENNCQNCGFNSVRMNGMEGHYTQILINGRPIFSGLAGVYGLELIPSNIIERVEVIRGGGSAMYGGNAIAGTLNIILKDPVVNSFELGLTSGVIGLGMSDSRWATPDISGSFNTSLVSDDFKSGMTLYGFSRSRGFFDANNDDISELSPLDNLTLGTRFYHRFGARSKLTFDFFNILEERNGGNKLETIWHERDVSESVKHNIKASSLSYDQFFRKYDILQVFVAGQFLNRESYYGANQDLNAYGKSKDRTYNIGAQYTADLGKSKLIFGFDNINGTLEDLKMGYPDFDNAVIENDTIVEIPHVENNYVANQSSNTVGAFVQYELKINKFKLLAGGRFDSYKISDYEQGTTKTGNVFIPRVSFMYDIFDFLQARLGVSTGYRAPQIFDEDLHIETSGSRQVINVNDPLLKQENSYSGTFSLDMNKNFKNVYFGLMLESFYTLLDNPFVNEIGIPDENGVVYYTRKNAESGAVVKGINTELRINTLKSLSVTTGFTFQRSEYIEGQDFDEKRFYKAPNNYGFVTASYDPYKNINLALTGTYTGKMIIPYFGDAPSILTSTFVTSNDDGELRETKRFFDLGIKLSYLIRLNGTKMEIAAGVKNIFNSYQNDFEIGADRDPTYIYGPVAPRTIYVSIKIGNLL